MSRIIRIFLIVLGAAALATFVASTASAANPKPKVQASIVLGPGNFYWGDVLLYRLRLSNNTAARQQVKIDFFIHSSQKALAGGMAHRKVDIGPRAQKFIDFRVMAQDGAATQCLDAYIGGKLADWTCAPVAGGKGGDFAAIVP